MPSHPVTHFEIQKYYQNEPNFNVVYSRNNEYKSIETQWMALYANTENVIYFDNFGVEHVWKEIKKFIGSKNIIANTYRIQAYHSIITYCVSSNLENGEMYEWEVRGRENLRQEATAIEFKLTVQNIFLNLKLYLEHFAYIYSNINWATKFGRCWKILSKSLNKR